MSRRLGLRYLLAEQSGQVQVAAVGEQATLFTEAPGPGGLCLTVLGQPRRDVGGPAGPRCLAWLSRFLLRWPRLPGLAIGPRPGRTTPLW